MSKDAIQENALRVLSIIFLSAGVISLLQAQSIRKDQPLRPANLQSVSDSHSLLNIKNISLWMSESGLSARTPRGNAGARFPRRTVDVLYQDGLLWGGIVNDPNPNYPQLRVGGATYNSGTLPGNIITPGTASSPPVAADPDDPYWRVWRIRKDWQELSATDQEVINDAAEIFEVDTAKVTIAMAQQVLDQYAADWNNWPADLGAPFYDHNGNGNFDAGIDEPGFANADQVLWTVFNDMAEGVTTVYFGSPPIGLEVQVTIWGYKSQPGLETAAFRRHRLINKSAWRIDSMFVAQWSDPDVGYFLDDLAGCDSVLGAGFVYNGYVTDPEFAEFGLNPAAVGYRLVQGPQIIVPTRKKFDPANRAEIAADFFSGRRRFEVEDPGMTSFANVGRIGGFGFPWGYDWTEIWYNTMRGFLPKEGYPIPAQHRCGPLQGRVTKFPVNGDPVTGEGDIDGCGENLPPGDRRIVLSSGPFTMNPGESQDIVFALSAAIGSNHTQSVNALKANLNSAKNFYEGLSLNGVTAIEYQDNIKYGSRPTDIQFNVVNHEADSVTVILYSPDRISRIELPLFDNGLHGDGAASDGNYGYSYRANQVSYGYSVDVGVRYVGGAQFVWRDVRTKLTTAGPLRAQKLVVGSDNLNHNKIATRGENLRFTLQIANDSEFDLSGVVATPLELVEGAHGKFLGIPNGLQRLQNLPANARGATDYYPDSAYYELQLYDEFEGGDSLHLSVYISADGENSWIDTLSFFVEALRLPAESGLMTPVNSWAKGALGYQVVYSRDLTGDSYELLFYDELPDSTLLYQVTNSRTGEIVVSGQPYPDPQAHNSQLIDGFQVTRGDTEPFSDFGDWSWLPEDQRWLTGVNWGGQMFFGGVDIGQNFFGSTLEHEDLVTVKIVFDENMQTRSAVYLRNSGYGFTGIGTFPGAAYDISNPNSLRRLNIIFTEWDDENGNKPPNNFWDPDTSSVAGREYLFVMASDYDSLTAGGYDDTHDIFFIDVQWILWAKVLPGREFLESRGELILEYFQKNVVGDKYTFTPFSSRVQPLPDRFRLAQNYPNPFNPQTIIAFSLPQTGKAKLEIFNVLGQRVKTLVDHSMTAGEYTLTWDGRADSGYRAASGIYFYRLTAGDFVQSRKMMLIR